MRCTEHKFVGQTTCTECGSDMQLVCRECDVTSEERVDWYDGDWLAVCRELGLVHHQSMGPDMPGTLSEVLAAIKGIRDAVRAAESRELSALAELDEVRAERDEARRDAVMWSRVALYRVGSLLPEDMFTTLDCSETDGTCVDDEEEE